jgi:VIT1/CCC1 family predicted Fe2+/Mn2+ transporter
LARAAVLGANDGLVSTASLMIGVAAAQADSFLITAGLAGISAGAMSMAVGEYVSVRSQNDIEESDRLLEIQHLAIDPDGELQELKQIYVDRGLTPELAEQVAKAMHENDALTAHLRDELGQFPHTKARPIQAAIASAASFTLGGVIPFLGAFAPTLGAKAWSIVGFHTCWTSSYWSPSVHESQDQHHLSQLCESCLVAVLAWLLLQELDSSRISAGFNPANSLLDCLQSLLRFTS